MHHSKITIPHLLGKYWQCKPRPSLNLQTSWFEWVYECRGGRFERSYFDVRIFNPSAPSNQPLHSAYRRHDKEKRRECQQRIHEVENASFTPLIFTTTGGMGDAATQFYKRLANLLSAKHSLSYGIVMGWLRCKLSFSLLRSAIMYIRGARSSLSHC